MFFAGRGNRMFLVLRHCRSQLSTNQIPHVVRIAANGSKVRATCGMHNTKCVTNTANSERNHAVMIIFMWPFVLRFVRGRRPAFNGKKTLVMIRKNYFDVLLNLLKRQVFLLPNNK